ncbi:uncharacterized protein LOC122394301 isoform X2 [Amphibalanus amphitrite]|nr:uncharacterized protein LOC122394301 isoform X2 [Amphibalanus amphitrite]XP_043247010.1 uncharacterized protein LOC122394301 isoform X2 [Amphibalanus amphitrite]
MELQWHWSAAAVLVLFSLHSASAHECYVCVGQAGNGGKCTETVALCEYEEQSCMTTVSWGSTPGWRLGVPMMLFVSKQCATDDYCEEMRLKNLPLCTRISYEDWRCTSCCKGDRCNYYIIDGASPHRAFPLLTGAALLLLALAHLRRL